jgi:hypothetical protein
MPKYTFKELTKEKPPKELAFDDDSVIIASGEFSHYRRPNPYITRVDSDTKSSSTLEDIFFTDHEDAPEPDLSQVYGSVDMLEEGADPQIANFSPTAMPMPQTCGSIHVDNAVIITSQVKDTPTCFLKSDATINPEILDMDLLELDMV